MTAEVGDHNFVLTPGINQPQNYAEPVRRHADATEKTGRHVGSLPLFMLIMDETDEAAWAKSHSYQAGADLQALGYMSDEGAKDAAAQADGSTAKTINLPEGAINLNTGTLVGSRETIARHIDEVAEMPGVRGMMFTFDEFERACATSARRCGRCSSSSIR